MKILNILFGPHADNLQKALSRTADRHRLLTSNLANINTPGYKRKDLNLAIPAMQGTPPQPFSLKATDPRHFTSTSEPSLFNRVRGEPVELSLKHNS
ncbi:MAG: flagellar basal body protein, partial [Fimbriimonadales bacterium]|nr:flagellar basal body protein [Fimbriimonadales bacterium]